MAGLELIIRMATDNADKLLDGIHESLHSHAREAVRERDVDRLLGLMDNTRSVVPTQLDSSSCWSAGLRTSSGKTNNRRPGALSFHAAVGLILAILGTPIMRSRSPFWPKVADM